MRAPALPIIACLWPFLAFAQGQAPTEVAPLTVMPSTNPPKVTATFPSAGQAVAPGVLVLSVAFDQKMEKTGFDIAAGAGGEAPRCLKTPRLLADGKTFALLCSTQPGKAYLLAINGKPAGGFVNLGGNRAAPATLSFTTTTGEPVRDLDAALKAANLEGVDVPVQEDPNLRGG